MADADDLVAAREEVGRLIIRVLQGLKVSPENQGTGREVRPV